jgi:hypothetical protein
MKTISIVKWRLAKPGIDVDSLLLAYWLMWASRPRDPNPDETGAYFIGDCGDVPERTFQRWCPYSVAEPSR